MTINGFIAPLEANEQRQITAFFVVPYFGACIHYPPPPPNQMVYISLKDNVESSEPVTGLANIDIQKPFSFSGVLRTSMYEDVQGTSAYVLEIAQITEYVSNENKGVFHMENTFTEP